MDKYHRINFKNIGAHIKLDNQLQRCFNKQIF